MNDWIASVAMIMLEFWGSWHPHFLTVGIQMCTDPPLFVPCCCTWPIIRSISPADSGWTLHACWIL